MRPPLIRTDISAPPRWLAASVIGAGEAGLPERPQLWANRHRAWHRSWSAAACTRAPDVSRMCRSIHRVNFEGRPAGRPSKDCFRLERRLLPALLEDNGCLLEALAIDVDALGLQVRDRLLGEVAAVRGRRRRLLDDLVGVGDLRRLLEGGGIHHA